MPEEVENFGRNVRFVAKNLYQPKSEDEVLRVLEKHGGDSIRVVGSRHSWSRLLESDAVILDLRQFRDVRVQQAGDQYVATVGAGCRISRLLEELERIADVTLPSIGLIDAQTIAGAISTGTHGSGKHSLSHYVTEVRFATLTKDGTAEIRTVDCENMRDLKAARCSLGAIGVILSVKLQCRANYRIEEHMRRHKSLKDVIDNETNYPLQQFYLVPWLWEFYAQHRREVAEPTSRNAWLFHLYWYWMIDVSMHIGICLLSRWLKRPGLVKTYCRHVAPTLTIENWRVVDQANKMLVMKHELFRHIEIEIFVRDHDLANALAYVEGLLKVCGGDEISESLRRTLSHADAAYLKRLQAMRGTYTHCYPICVRRVLADETLISMASGDGVVYSISFISYQRPNERAAFVRFAQLLAESTAELFNARPHWGKLNPLSGETLKKLYPNWESFQETCNQRDPNAVFRNARLTELLSCGQSQTCEPIT